MRRWIDLAHPYTESMTHQPVTGPPCIRTVLQVGRDPFNLQEFTFVTHLGTHVDAPLHFLPGGRTIDQFPLEDLAGPGWVLPVEKGRGEPITARDLEATGAPVGPGQLVLIATGWSRHFSTPEYLSHPYLTEDAAGWLLERRVKLVGVDAFSVDLPVPLRPPDFDWPVHRRLLGREVLIAENLTGLEGLAGRPLTIGAFPLKIAGGDGAPARIFALLEE